RGGIGSICQSRHRCRRARRATSGRRREIIREIMERTHVGDRVEKRHAQVKGYPTMKTRAIHFRGRQLQASRLGTKRHLKTRSKRLTRPGEEISKTSLTKRPAWKALAAHHKKIKTLHLRQLFAADPKRGQRLTLEAVGLFLDYSKNRVTDQTMRLL